jgi:hypothetical protein
MSYSDPDLGARFLIERMQRNGASERQIVAAVRDVTGTPTAPRASAAPARHLLKRLRGAARIGGDARAA